LQLYKQQIQSGAPSISAPTWTTIEVSGPHARTRPVEWPRPATIDIRTRTPSPIDAHRPPLGRAKPRRAIIDFQGSRSRIATPPVAWTIKESRAGAVPNANASQPVRNAIASNPSRATLVCDPSLIAP